MGGLANTGSALNIHIYLRSSAANFFFQGYRLFRKKIHQRAAPQMPGKRAGEIEVRLRDQRRRHGSAERLLSGERVQ